jgi:hypothetical protein
MARLRPQSYATTWKRDRGASARSSSRQASAPTSLQTYGVSVEIRVARSWPSIPGSARARSTSAAAEPSVEITPICAPTVRMCFVRRRVSIPEMPTTPCALR